MNAFVMQDLGRPARHLRAQLARLDFAGNAVSEPRPGLRHTGDRQAGRGRPVPSSRLPLNCAKTFKLFFRLFALQRIDFRYFDLMFPGVTRPRYRKRDILSKPPVCVSTLPRAKFGVPFRG